MTVSPANLARGFDAAGLRRVGSTIVGPQLFNRRCKIIIEDARASVIALSDRNRTTDRTVQHPVLIINEHRNDLRVRFSIKRDIWGVPQPCNVEVYNLSPENRRLIQSSKNLRVQVIAGYDPPQVGTQTRDPDAFLKLVGTITGKQNNPRHDGPDWITKIEGGDGARAYWGSRVNKSWSGGTPKGEVLKQLLQGRGTLGPSAVATLEKAAAGRTWKNGKTFNGRIAPITDWLLRDLGLQSCIVNEEVILFPVDGTTQEVYELSADSGLIGSPEFASPPREGHPQLLKARWLLTADVRPGALILLNSESHTGQYRCRSMEHKGDTDSGDWMVEAELQALKGAT